MAQLTDIIGFASVQLPGTAGTFVQLPSIECDEIGLASTVGDIQLAGGPDPGSDFCVLQTSTSKALAVTPIPTGGNANNLWLANVTNTAQTVGFIWRSLGLRGAYNAV